MRIRLRSRWLNKIRALSIGLMCLFVANTTRAQTDNWPQFRGPNGQGIVADVELPTNWSAKENIDWKTQIPGLGHSSPVHDGKTLWMTTASRDGSNLGVVSVNLDSGEIESQLTVFEPDSVEEIHHDNSYASPTPVLRDGHLYVHYGTYGTACVACESNDIVWTNTDFPVEHQGGPGSSPVLFDNLLILTLDGAQKQRVVALDFRDGSLRWERARSAPFRTNPITHRAFSTPLLHDVDGESQLICPGADQCHAYEPATGNEIWHVRYNGFSNVPRPVANGPVAVICTGFFKPELWAVDLSGTGNVTESHRRWKYRGPVSDTPSPILLDQQLIMVSNKGIVTSVDLDSGDRNWMLRIGGNFSSSPIYAGGLLYFCSEEGVTKIVDPHLEKPKLVNANRLDGQIMASPVVVDQDLLIRTSKALYRIGH